MRGRGDQLCPTSNLRDYAISCRVSVSQPLSEIWFGESNMKITKAIFEAYLQCKYKAWRMENGEKGVIHAYTDLIDQLQNEYVSIAAKTLLSKAKSNIAVTLPAFTSDLIAQRHLIILNTTVDYKHFSFHCDGLKRINNDAAISAYLYEPVLFSVSPRIREEHRLSLAFAAFVLGKVQGVQPDQGTIVFGNSCSVMNVQLRGKHDKFKKQLDELTGMLSRRRKPDLFLNKHCEICPFRDQCRNEAIDQDSLSLLSGMKEQDIAKENNKGIFTVHQLSYTFRPRRRPNHLKDRPPPYYHSLRAQALREKKVYVFQRPEIPKCAVNLFIDLEGDSTGDSVYLIGALATFGENTEFQSFWADDHAQESEILNDLWNFIAGFENPHIFFYGAYDSKALRRMAVKAGNKKLPSLLDDHSTNVVSTIYRNVYFPTFSNSLKEIGRFLGCSWSDPEASGWKSIAWRIRWERTGDDTMKEELIRYNKEDCMALHRLIDYLQLISTNNEDTDNNVTSVEDLMQQSDFRLWGQRKFAVDDFRQVADCTYFDYQRTKVYLRSNPELKAVHRHKRKRAAKQTRPNQVVVVHAHKCWRCKSTDIVKDTDRWHKKFQYDLRVSSGSIKRWITEFRTPFHHCLRCKIGFFPPSYKAKERYGHSLIAWVMHQHISNRISFERLEFTLRECFGIRLQYSRIHHIKYLAARYYKRTYNQILRNIIGGGLVHADETKAKLTIETGYVWVFANVMNVAYIYRPTREGKFLHELLSDFDGVLITDFYAAYDSLDCRQQKCLLHLMWDINGDLLKHPFDEDLKFVARGFGELLRAIINTVDRYGLKARFLRKHKKDVAKFYRNIEARELVSDVARHYLDRFVKYRQKLFTFLDHDGVAWNNNNAEHAIKPFAKYRLVTKGMVTRKGLDAYLVLLSIFETCEYRGVSFLDFLLSKERDIDRYCQTVW
jgi:predicted RecB family nuclease